jgi:hypothetical protein
VVTHTVGDAMLCSFADPKAAFDAAANIQSRIDKDANPTSGMIVKARIGLAYGPVRVIAGKVSGDAVNTAGLLMEKCPPGEILADQALVTAVGAVKEMALEPHGNVEGLSAYRVVRFTPSGDTTTRMAAIPLAAKASPAPAPAAAPVAARAPAKPPATPASAAAPAASVVAVSVTFSGLEQRFQPSDGEVQLGRGRDNQVIVPLRYVSRKHAKIVWRQNLPYLVNLSQNGVCVRLKDSAKETVCHSEMRMEGSGEIVLCASFSVATSAAEIIGYRLHVK